MQYMALLRNTTLLGGSCNSVLPSEDKSKWSLQIWEGTHGADFFLFVLLKTNVMCALIGILIYTRWKNYLLARSSAESSLEL